MKKSIISMVLTLALLLSSSIPVQAATASSYAWLDKNGDIIFQVKDRTRTSALAYKTVGITITRCIKGTKMVSPAYETVAIAFSTSSAEAIEDGGTTSTLFRFRESELMTRIAAFYGDPWLSDLRCLDEQPVYLLINSIMVCVEYDKDSVPHQQGVYYDDGSRLGHWTMNVYANIPDCRCSDCSGTVQPLKNGFTYYKNASQSDLICYGEDCVAHQGGGGT